MKNNLLEGVFFNIYHWFKKLNLDNIPEYTAICLLAVLITFNLITIAEYIRFLIGYPSVNISKGLAAIVGLALIVVLYFILINNDKHVKIYKTYAKSKWNTNFGSFITIAYIFLTIIGFISLIWVK